MSESNTLNLKSQINSLAELQKIDSEIYMLKEEKAAKPQELKVLEDSFEEKKKNVADAEKKSLDLQKQKKDRELELSSKEESAKKLQTQLYSLKTNKEYQAMLLQIEKTKADASVVEDQTLAILDQIDKVKLEVQEEKKKLQEEEKKFQGEKKKVEYRVKEIDDRLAQLDAQRKQVMPNIAPKILSQYERILKNRDGLAMAAVENNSCAGCNMLVPPQVINLIRMYERLITCEICNRILYIKEDN